MTTTLATKSQLAAFRAELHAGKQTGNIHLTTQAGLRIAVASGSAATVGNYLLDCMGIRARVEQADNGLALAVSDHHAITAIMRALRGVYQLAVAITEDGRQAVRIWA